MSTTSSTPRRTVKVPHLVAAVVFLGTAATWLLVTTGVVSTLAVPYVVPGLLVAAGVLGLVAVAGGTRRRAPEPGRVEEPAYDADPDPLPWRDPLDELDDLDAAPDDAGQSTDQRPDQGTDDGTEQTAPVTPTRRFSTTDPTSNPTSSTEEDR